MNIDFFHPWVFALLILPLLVALLLPRAATALPAALRMPFFSDLQAGLNNQGKPVSKWWLALAIIAWILLVTAAAQPRLIGKTVHIPMSGRSLMMAVDISGSMETEDMKIGGQIVNRLQAVKKVAGDFIKKRKGDRVGLILFGSQAYLQAPLTFDRKTVNILLNEAQIGLAGKQTAIGDAIGLAIKRLRKLPAKNRVLILLTDGANTAGSVDPLKAADLAAQEGVRIYTIGVGADSQLINTPFGVQQIGSNELDEDTLQAIASKTSGRYFRARDVRSLTSIYRVLDQIEPVSKDDLSYRPMTELYHWPLALALLLSLLIAIGSRSDSRQPRHTSELPRV